MSSEFPSITTLVQQYRQGARSPRDVVEQCLRRCEQFESAIHAWISIDADGARRQAEQLERRIRNGEPVGPLAGIPIGIKDIIDIAGLPTRAGSLTRAGHRAERDAPVVLRLRQAGAILLGKTVTTEFACFDPPPTRNPWNPAHTPGGSSSGSAAAVSLGMCVAAIGSQTGGSIVRPASYCGVAGFKPTRGSVSTEGVVPVSEYLDHVGPLAASVADLQSLFAVLAIPKPPDTQPLDRAVVLEEFFFDQADAEVAAITRSAIDRLRAAGMAATPIALPTLFRELHAMHRRIMAYAVAHDHQKKLAATPHLYGPNLSSLIREGMELSEISYREALAHQLAFRDQIAHCIPPGTVALMPSTPTAAPDTSTTGSPLFNSPWSYSGLPSVTIPCGLTRNRMPCGLQLVAAAGDDWRLLATSQMAEQAIAFEERPPATKDSMAP